MSVYAESLSFLFTLRSFFIPLCQYILSSALWRDKCLFTLIFSNTEVCTTLKFHSVFVSYFSFSLYVFSILRILFIVSLCPLYIVTASSYDGILFLAGTLFCRIFFIGERVTILAFTRAPPLQDSVTFANKQNTTKNHSCNKQDAAVGTGH